MTIFLLAFTDGIFISFCSSNESHSVVSNITVFLETFYLTLSQTSPSFYVSALYVF